MVIFTHTDAIAACACYSTICLFLAIALLLNLFNSQRGHNAPFRVMVGVTLLVEGVIDLVFLLNERFFDIQLPETMMLSVFVTIVLVFLSGETLMSSSYPKLKMVVAYSAPFLACVLLELILNNPHSFVGFAIAFWFSIIGFVVLGFRIVRFDRKLREAYSNLSSRTAKGFMHLIATAYVASTIYAFPLIFPESRYVNLMYIVYYVLVAVAWCALAAFACHQMDVSAMNEVDSVPANSNVPLQKVLLETMEKDKLYLDPDLDVEKLVASLGTNRTYLYNVLHKDMNTTFYDYINGLRLEAAKQMLRSSSEKMEAIALACGFNSTRTFNRVFKNAENCTPSEWRVLNSR